MLDDIIKAADAAYETYKSSSDALQVERLALLAAIYDMVTGAVAAKVPAELREYLSYAGDKTAHIYTDQPFNLTLAIPGIAPISVVVDARNGVDVRLSVAGEIYPSLTTAIGAAKREA